jgi:hypothetical protein
MEHIIKQPPIIRLPHLGLMALGLILVNWFRATNSRMHLVYYNYTFDDIQKDQAKQLVQNE